MWYIENSIVPRAPRGTRDVVPLEGYVASLEDTTLPEAGLQWKGTNRMEIETSTASGQVVSIQVSYHPGWHATVNGRRGADPKGRTGVDVAAPGAERPLPYRDGIQRRLGIEDLPVP